MEKSIIFWLGGPPICCKGVFDAVARAWNGKSYYVCTKPIDENRAKIYNPEAEEGCCAEYVFLHDREDAASFGMEFLREHSDDIHIFNGYIGSSSPYLFQLMKLNPNAHIVIWAERPGYNKGDNKKMAGKIKHQLILCKHRYYALRLRRKVSALLPLGDSGVTTYRRLGWHQKQVFPFLYLPTMREDIPPVPSAEENAPIKFVYLGRFSKDAKGTDLLIQACKALKNDCYTLTLVGGYGNYKEQVFSYIEKNEHLTFGGTWPIEEACDRLSQYDVCIVPSRYEGWNPTVNEALMAGIGCIVTDEAVSDEMVAASGAGMVVSPDSAALADAIDFAATHPECVDEWKRKAFAYRNRMTADVCANYFIDVLHFLFSGEKQGGKPIPPWNGNG